MKQYIDVCILFGGTFAAVAMPVIEFTNWDNLIEQSPDIVIARRISSPEPRVSQLANHPKVISISDGVGSCQIEVISILKGSTKTGPAQLQAWCSLPEGFLTHQGDLFLVFASGHDGSNSTNAVYSAFQDYRIVNIAPDIYASAWTNALAGKPLREQVKKILRYRLGPLNEELARDLAEKKRLEDGLKELDK